MVDIGLVLAATGEVNRNGDVDRRRVGDHGVGGEASGTVVVVTDNCGPGFGALARHSFLGGGGMIKSNTGSSVYHMPEEKKQCLGQHPSYRVGVLIGTTGDIASVVLKVRK